MLYGLIRKHNSNLREARNKIISQNNALQDTNKTLKDAKEKSQESDKLKTAFIQNMSHEIRTPMNGIIGFSELLANDRLNEEKKKIYTDIIIENSKQLLKIVNDIITISSIEAKQLTLDLSETDINQILNNCYTNFYNEISSKGLDFEVTLLPENDSTKYLTDSSKLTQIISNLLTNAVKFTDTGYIKFGCIRKDNMLEFFVQDSGIGIADEFQNKIFDRFTQAEIATDKVHSGNGLGLSISKAYVELMKGSLSVSSEPGNGSRFSFTLAPQSNNHLSSMGENQVAFTIKKPLTILVAEDEEYNFLYIQEFLSSYDIEIIHAKNGIEAIDICEKRPEIDLVLMDIKMPKVDGYRAAKHIKEKRKELPVIAQTAYALENEIKQYADVFDDYLTKPVETDKFEKILKRFSL